MTDICDSCEHLMKYTVSHEGAGGETKSYYYNCMKDPALFDKIMVGGVSFKGVIECNKFEAIND